MYTVDIHKYKENRDSAIEELKIAISFGKREKIGKNINFQQQISLISDEAFVLL